MNFFSHFECGKILATTNCRQDGGKRHLLDSPWAVKLFFGDQAVRLYTMTALAYFSFGLMRSSILYRISEKGSMLFAACNFKKEAREEERKSKRRRKREKVIEAFFFAGSTDPQTGVFLIALNILKRLKLTASALRLVRYGDSRSSLNGQWQTNS